MGKSKQLARPLRKPKAKVSAPETADEFQEAADREEEAGGKHRAGDPAKSGRAFVRALGIYDQGLQKHPSNFDLAYNKARLQFEITQQPILVEHIGLPFVDLLQQTLEAHRYALRLNEENADVLFNTSQVLITLAEQLSDRGNSLHAVPLLQESLELLSACLSRQEMLLEQQQMDLEDVEEGGVSLEPGEKPASSQGSDVSEQTALIETPITAQDLLDTVHASLSALTTLVPIVEQPSLQTYGDMARTLTEKKASNYISLLPAELQDASRFAIALDRAIFIAAFADAQYSSYMIELETYRQRLDEFNITGREQSAHVLSAEAEARTEMTLSALYRSEGQPGAPLDVLWKQLSLAQDLYTQATKINTDEANDRRANLYQLKGNLELLRHRLASAADSTLSDSVKGSAKTLIQNAQTYYKGAAQLARADGDSELEVKAQERWFIAAHIGSAQYGIEPKQAPFEGSPRSGRGDLIQAVEECIEEGLVDMASGKDVMKWIRQ